MRIEDEIKQRSFNNEFQKLAVNILFTHGWLMSLNKDLLNGYDITVTQYNILRILRGQHPRPISINLLKERMLDKMSDTSRLVERLRVKGLIDRKVCKNDRRKSDVKITDEGLELLKKLDHIDKETENMFSSISKEEAVALNTLLDKLRG